jgi:hypothetical protein
MPRVEKHPLDPARIRTVPKTGFSWIDRRLVREGFLDDLAGPDILLYLFLCAVSDRNGLSFFGDRRVARTLKLTETTIGHARRRLEQKELILYRSPLYQVLALPDSPTADALERISVKAAPVALGDGDPRAVGHILGDIL